MKLCKSIDTKKDLSYLITYHLVGWGYSFSLSLLEKNIDREILFDKPNSEIYKAGAD